MLFAAATGLRPGEWIALEHRDIDVESGVLYVKRAFETDASNARRPTRARVPCRSRRVALAALDAATQTRRSPLVFPAARGGYLDLHNFRNREWKPAQRELGIDPIRRIYDLRHTFATFALRAGVSTFDLSRYMGASLTMIDRHYGHLAKDGRQHAINLLDTFTAPEHRRPPAWTLWTHVEQIDASATPLRQTRPKQEKPQAL